MQTNESFIHTDFRHQMDTDEADEVIYRQHAGSHTAGRGQSSKQPQQPNSHNHYHFNSNNHLLNHSHSMQQSGYSKQRLSAGNGSHYNGGKSLDSALQPEDRFYQDLNAHSPLHIQK